MKILQIHNYYLANGGEDAVLLAERKMLESYGNEVVQYTVDNTKIAGVMGKVMAGINLVYSRESKDLVKEFIKINRPDVMHVHNFFPLITPSVYDAAKETNTAVVQTFHNYRILCASALLVRNDIICEKCIKGSPYNAVKYGCYRSSRLASLLLARMIAIHRNRETWGKKIDAIIALTEFARKKFIQGGIPAEKLTVKPNFVADIGFVRKASSVRNGGLFVGRLSKEKGVFTLLKAWKNFQIPLRVAGVGPLENALATSSRYITMLGFLSEHEVGSEMMKASFLVMPSEWYEGFPMVLVEAFSCGLPVVASRLGSMAEVVEDGVTGVLFEPGNPADLAEKIQWMDENPDACMQMGENARRLYLERYTPEVNYHLLMKIYQEAIDSHV